MKTVRLILATAVLLAVASAMLVIGASSAASAWDQEIAYEVVQNGGGHCANGPAGPSSQTRLAIRPKTVPQPAISYVSGDMTQQGGITQAPNAWIFHLIGPASLESGTVTINVAGQDHTVAVTIENRNQCGDTPPPPPETCETNPDLCPPPPPPEAITVCRDGKTITIFLTELLEGDVEGDCPVIPEPPEVPEVPETPEVPKVPEVVPPAVVTAPPFTATPQVPDVPTVDTPSELAFTGSAETAGLAAIGTALTLAGLFMVRGRKTQRGLVR